MSYSGLFRLCFLTIALSVVSLGSLSCGPCNRRGVITSISPDSTTVGGDQFVLTVNGSYFVPHSRVIWNGFPVVTTYVNSSQLLAEIPASDIAVAGTALVYVFNPPGSSTYIFTFTLNNGCGGASNGVSFTIKS
ncbi:MAG TPA: IPT/TIG domain-containing protein [Terriglobales bacterium]|nr:IPT/TIG domain-containing protein [Terriglobales bacterium]